MSQTGSKQPSGLHVTYRLFLSDFNSLNAKLNPICHLLTLLGDHHILHFSRIRVNEIYIYRQFFPLSKKNQISNFVTIHPVAANLFHVDRQTDGRTDVHDESNSHFSQFSERPLQWVCQKDWNIFSLISNNMKHYVWLIDNLPKVF